MTGVVGDDEVGGEVITEIGPWAMVPVWVLAKGLKPATLVTYVALRSFADQRGGAYPRAETIAERAHLAVGTVRNGIQELRAKGLLTTTERRRADGSLAGLVYKLFDVDPSPNQGAEPRRKGGKPGPKPGTQNPRSKAGTSSNVPPSTEAAGTPTNAGGVHQVMQGGAPTNAPKNTPGEHSIGTPSEPASQVRRSDPDVDLPDGQITITGEIEKAPDRQVKVLHDTAMGIGRDWVGFRKEKGCPVVMRSTGDPIAAVAKLVLPALQAGYTDLEIKNAMVWADTGIPTTQQLETGLGRVRAGWRPGRDWRPGQGRSMAGGHKPSTTDARVGDALALAERFRLEEAS